MEETLQKVNQAINDLTQRCHELDAALKKGLEINDVRDQARYFADHIVDLLEKTREPADRLETIIPDDIWPFPKYSEMLFIM